MKIKFNALACKVTVDQNATFVKPEGYEYENDTIAYAVKHFISKSERFREECTTTSWQLRVAKGKQARPRRFTYYIPAVLMELPGDWVTVSGRIDGHGVNVKYISIDR